MTIIHETAKPAQVNVRSQVYSPLETYWAAFQDWRKRRRLLANFSDLSDRELTDIGITRGEIDYVASHQGSDPRGILSVEWLRYLPTMDGQIGPTDFR